MYYKGQANALPAFKEDNHAFSDIHSQVLQNVLKRLERSFENFFEGSARYPKPKNESRWRSLTYPQANSLWVRTHACPSCGWRGPRDSASSLVIRMRALEALGKGMPEVTPMEAVPPPAAAIAAGEPCRGSGKLVPALQTNLGRGDGGTGSLPLQG